MSEDFEGLLGVLAEGRVDYILIGGFAATAHGSARATFDLDVVYSREAGNLERLAATLQRFAPYLRGAPPGLPFRLDLPTLRAGLNFTLSTTLGPLDLFGEITAGGGYDDLIGHTVVLEIFGHPCRCITLDKLIEVKRAGGRPKDLESIAELESLREERNK